MNEKIFKRKILICGGGTAGHVYPAIAIIEYIKKNYPESKIQFVGTEKGMEKKFILESGVDFKGVKAAGLNIRKNLFKKLLNYLKFFCYFVIGFLKSVRIIRNFNPDAILGMGGYVCGPVLTAGILLKKKIFLHEQNYIPGRLNTFFSKFAKYIFVSFKETKKFLNMKNEKIIFTGNPVREKIKNTYSKKPDYRKWGLKENRFTIVAFGGSLGADKINTVIINLYDYFRDSNEIQMVLISGKRFYDESRNTFKKILKVSDNLIFRIFPFVDEMEGIYRITDIAISRSGANTIAELTLNNIPAILIPYPQAIDNHQMYNARFLEKKGKALVIPEEDLTENVIIDEIQKLLKEGRKKFKQMKEKKLDFQKIDSEKIISDFILGYN